MTKIGGLGHAEPPDPLPETIPAGTFVRRFHGPLAAYTELRLEKRREQLVYANNLPNSADMCVLPEDVIWESLTESGRDEIVSVIRAYNDAFGPRRRQ